MSNKCKGEHQQTQKLYLTQKKLFIDKGRLKKKMELLMPLSQPEHDPI